MVSNSFCEIFSFCLTVMTNAIHKSIQFRFISMSTTLNVTDYINLEL